MVCREDQHRKHKDEGIVHSQQGAPVASCVIWLKKQRVKKVEEEEEEDKQEEKEDKEGEGNGGGVGG